MNSSSILDLNDGIEKAARAAGFGVVTKPEKYLIGQGGNDIGGYVDCVHFRHPGCITTFSLLFNLMLRMMGGP